MSIRWGIIGTGQIAGTFVDAMKAVEDGIIVAVASRTENKAKEFAARYGIERVYGSYEELLTDIEVDAVYIATPHSEHFRHATMAMEHKKHVLCEKPMALNADDVKRMAEVAKEKGVFLMEAMWTKFLPVTKVVKDWIAAGRIGEIVCLDARFGFESEYDVNSRLYSKELGGGALLDVGVYPVTYALIMLGKKPEKIKSSLKFSPSGVDEINTIQFIYQDGPAVNLQSSICAQIGTKAVITGMKGKIVVNDFYGANCATLFDMAGNQIECFHQPFDSNGYEFEIREVNRCISNGLMESEVHPLCDTIEVMTILDEIREEWNLVYPGGK